MSTIMTGQQCLAHIDTTTESGEPKVDYAAISELVAYGQ